MNTITLLTDFGIKTNYVAQMKAVISKITEDVQIIDITHDITPHDIREGSFNLLTSTPYFPVGTIHVAVIDPGVGTQRRGIIITTPSQILIGPDNGLLIPAARYLGNFTVYEIKNKEYMLEYISNTFHGRDIFAPTAAHIANGIEFEEFGPIINDYVDLNLGKPEIKPKYATGNVIFIDTFGNIITNIDGVSIEEYLDFNKKIIAFIGKEEYEIPFVKSYDYVKKGELLATIGSNNLLEFCLNQGNAGNKLKVKPDESIKILYG